MGLFSKNVTTWYRVFASLEEAELAIPMNRLVAVEIDTKRLCFARTEKGYFATDEKCPHQGLPISRGGFCEDGTIVCPFHRYAWNLKSGREVEKRENNIQLYPVEIRETGIYIGVEKKVSRLF